MMISYAIKLKPMYLYYRFILDLQIYTGILNICVYGFILLRLYFMIFFPKGQKL